MATLIGSALSSRMLKDSASVRISDIDADEARRICRCATEVIPVVGHESTARVIWSEIGAACGELAQATPKGQCPLFRRADEVLCPGDTLLVAEYQGPRLPEGATALPPGAELKWRRIIVEGPGEPRRAKWRDGFSAEIGRAKEMAAHRVEG